MKMFRLFSALVVFLLLSAFAEYRNHSHTEQLQLQTTASGFRLPWTTGVAATLVQDGVGASHLNQLDFLLPDSNEYVTAAKNGTVFFAKYNSNRSSCNSGDYYYANMVVIQHGENEYSWYVHLAQSQQFVHKGDNVVAGQVIGIQGNTGWMSTYSCTPMTPTPTPISPTTGKHLHFMISSGFDDRQVSNWFDPSQVDILWPSSGSIVPVNFSEINWSDLRYPHAPLIAGDIEGYPLHFYVGTNFSGAERNFVFPGAEYNLITNNFDNTIRSIRMLPGWSVKASDTLFLVNSICLSGNYSDLSRIRYPNTNISLDSTISHLKIYQTTDCNNEAPPPIACFMPPYAPNAPIVGAIDCSDPTPTPVPGVTPIPTTPPSQTGTWSVKSFSSINECNDSPNCSPSSLYYQSTVSGPNFNLIFNDGKAFGTGSDHWGTIFKQTYNFPSGTYYFHADHDDGVKIWINGSAKMDVLGSSETNNTCPGIYLSGPTELAILWKNTGGPAHLNFSVDQNGATCNEQQKWNVKYYHDPNLCSSPDCNLSQVYCETEIGGTWFHIDPYPNGQACGDSDQTWGSIWKQTINFSEGDYVFHADHDDGIKIFLGDSNIMDVAVNEMGNKACPARHLNGNVPVTIIHNNNGGDARINVWWDTNTSVCDQVAYNIWVWKDANDVSRVTVENGDINKVNLYLGRSGLPIEITRTLWYSVQNGIEAIIPQDVDSFLVDQGFVPTIGDLNADEWSNSSVDPHWVIRKKFYTWIDEQGSTRLTYQGEYGRPQIRYYTTGSSEQYSTTLWYDLADGSGIEAVLPDNVVSVKLDKWIRPMIHNSASTYWQEDNYWLIKRLITVDLQSDNQVRVTYQRGLPLPVTLGRYGQMTEARSDLWQQEQVNGQTNYFFILPSDVIAFQIEGGPVPILDTWVTWIFANYHSTHWVAQTTTWIYKNENNETLVLYANPLASPEDVDVFYYLYGDTNEYQTTSWWTDTTDGLVLVVPRDVESFLLARGPAPLITVEALTEWHAVSTDGKWINRKPIKISVDDWNSTVVTYWHEQDLHPNIHYVLNDEEVITSELWTPVGDGQQAIVPAGSTYLKIDINNQPYLEPSAETIWKFISLPDLWLELISTTVTSTPTATPTVTQTMTNTYTATPTITATLTITATPTATVFAAPTRRCLACGGGR